MTLTDALKLSIYGQLGAIELLLCLRRPNQILKFYQPLVGNKSPSRELLSPVWGIIEPLLGIKKPTEGINKPYLGDFVISSAASEAKTSVNAQTPAKAVDTLYERICLRTSRHSHT